MTQYFKEFDLADAEKIDFFLEENFKFKIKSNDDLSIQDWNNIHESLKETYGEPLISENSVDDNFAINENALWEFWGGVWYFRKKDICSYAKLKFISL